MPPYCSKHNEFFTMGTGVNRGWTFCATCESEREARQQAPKKFTLEINLGNELMQTSEDVAVALQHVRVALLAGGVNGRICDGNGNRVGEFGLRQE